MNMKGGELLDLIQTVVIVLVAISAYHYLIVAGSMQSSIQSGVAKGIVIVDSKSVLNGYMDVMKARVASGENMSEGQLQSSGANFGAEYLRAVKKYRDAGYLVIDKQYALGVPVGSDISEQIGKALNLEIKPVADPFTLPSAE